MGYKVSSMTCRRSGKVSVNTQSLPFDDPVQRCRDCLDTLRCVVLWSSSWSGQVNSV